MGDTKISWTRKVWNPTVGCTKVSKGCDACYAFALHDLRHEAWKDGWTTAPEQYREPFDVVQLAPQRLDAPLRWQEPQRVFVNSISDLFHPKVPDGFLDRVFAVMALSPRHTFQILTKRPRRMARYVNAPGRRALVRAAAAAMDVRRIRSAKVRRDQRLIRERHEIGEPAIPWPLPNAWLGVSVEDQAVAYRVGELLRVLAAIRFLSCEPLVGALNVRPYIGLTAENEWRGEEEDEKRGWGYDGFSGGFVHPLDRENDPIYDPRPGVHWIIAGGESGKGHRPVDHAWIRSLRDQAHDAGIAFWGKQDAGPRSEMDLPPDLGVREMPEPSGMGGIQRGADG